jgi:hypothetical protein
MSRLWGDKKRSTVTRRDIHDERSNRLSTHDTTAYETILPSDDCSENGRCCNVSVHYLSGVHPTRTSDVKGRFRVSQRLEQLANGKIFIESKPRRGHIGALSLGR